MAVCKDRAVTDAAVTQPPLALTLGASPEAQSLLDQWNAQWPGVQPWSWAPREKRPDEWVRFHTLADGRQRIRHRRDARTVRRRFRHIVRGVEHLTGLPATTLLVADHPRPGARRDRALSVIPELASWVTDLDLDLEDEVDGENEGEEKWPPSTHSFRSGPVDDHLLTALILLVHEQEEDFILAPEDLSWAISAYDGGIDVVLRRPDETAVLAGWLWPWLPPAGWPGIHSWSRKATHREMHRGLGFDDVTGEDEDLSSEALVAEADDRR